MWFPSISVKTEPSSVDILICVGTIVILTIIISPVSAGLRLKEISSIETLHTVISLPPPLQGQPMSHQQPHK